MADNRTARVHTPAFLQSLAIGFSDPMLIADRVSPRVRVNKQSDKYRVFGRNTMIDRSGHAEWHPGTIPNAIETKWSEDTYFAKIYKLRSLLLDSEVRNADADIDPRERYVQNVTRAMRIAREARVASLFTTAANYPGAHVVTKGGGAEWNTVGGDVPLTDIDAGVQKVKQAAMVSGQQVTVVIPEVVFDTALKRNTGILDKVKYSERGVVTADLLAAVLGVGEVIISATMSAGSAVENAATDILTGYATTYLWGDNVWIGVVGVGNIDTPAFSRSFNWTPETGGQDMQIRQYRSADEGQEGDWIEGKEAIGEKITFSSAGYLIKNVLSTI